MSASADTRISLTAQRITLIHVTREHALPSLDPLWTHRASGGLFAVSAVDAIRQA